MLRSGSGFIASDYGFACADHFQELSLILTADEDLPQRPPLSRRMKLSGSQE
jgi:hypothetical protein